MQEVWRDIKGYERMYQISNLGRVRSLDRILIHNIHNTEYIRRGYILSVNKRNKKQDYLSIRLKRGAERKSFYVHRLVADSFIENTNKKNEVNHIDGNPKNNVVNNLEWVTPSENIRHSYMIGKHKKRYGKDHHNSKNVAQYNEELELIKIWDSMMDIERELGISQSVISSRCRGKNKVKSAKGFIWKYI